MYSASVKKKNNPRILIAHQLLWQNIEAHVSNFQESPLAGEPRQRLFHIHSVNRYQNSGPCKISLAVYCDKLTVATFNNNLVQFTGAIFFVVENLTTFD